MLNKFIGIRFNRHTTIRLFSFEFSSESKLKLYNILLKTFPVEPTKINKLLKLYGEKIFTIPEKKFIENCKICREHNIMTQTVVNILTCLTINTHLLKHRIFLLEEMGVSKININIIWKLSHYMNLPATEFKHRMKIPMEQHIMTNISPHIVENLSDMPFLDLLDESLPVNIHYEKCFSYYIKSKFGSDKISLKHRGRKYKSFRLMTELINIFIEKFDVDLQYIRNHLIILDMCPNQVQYVLESFKDTKIANLTIQEIFKKFHEIVACDPENTKKLLQSFKEYGLDNNILLSCLRIFKIRNEDFVDKMDKILAIPDIRVWCKTPRILFFIIRKNIVNERIEFFRKSNDIKWVNLYLLTSDRNYFRKYKQGELNFVKKKKYIRYILSKELGSENEHLINTFQLHPYWNRVSFVDLDDTLRIIKNYFSIEDICSNIHIILYPWSTINKVLKSIKESDKYNKYTSSQQLALCLYLIEKDNHFTGDGIWNIMEQEQQLKDNEKMTLEIDEPRD
ncbi:transcription termination factor 5, mitochondrial [Vespula pensylvanica]|uniref:Uncharacterized protein n=1 Tax=Vespula pensylvanica TaxID=30213 RepID=A0A834NKK1_VESPE|nr:transcription termination factor 5, mitochondrial [Vespula pensylvanica]KAF7410868.1 hypothetical protein H0235_013475 [Vespula pensylvanica]